MITCFPAGLCRLGWSVLAGLFLLAAAEAQALITEETLPLEEPTGETAIEGGAKKVVKENGLFEKTESDASGGAAAAGAALATKGWRLPPPIPLPMPDSAPRAGEALPPGSHLTVREKFLADGHKVEQSLSGNPLYLGREVIVHPGGRKVYRYYSGSPHRPVKDETAAPLNPDITIEYRR